MRQLSLWSPDAREEGLRLRFHHSEQDIYWGEADPPGEAEVTVSHCGPCSSGPEASAVSTPTPLTSSCPCCSLKCREGQFHKVILTLILIEPAAWGADSERPQGRGQHPISQRLPSVHGWWSVCSGGTLPLRTPQDSERGPGKCFRNYKALKKSPTSLKLSLKTSTS